MGVVVGKKEWIDSILTFKSNMDSGMFYPIQTAADTALALGEEWFKEPNDIYYGREKQAYELLDALGCRYRKGQAGLFVWAELPEGYEGDSFAFSDEVMEKTDVFPTGGNLRIGGQALHPHHPAALRSAEEGHRTKIARRFRQVSEHTEEMTPEWSGCFRRCTRQSLSAALAPPGISQCCSEPLADGRS